MITHCQKCIQVPVPGDWKKLRFPFKLYPEDFQSYKFKIDGTIYTKDTVDFRAAEQKANIWSRLQQ